MNPTEDTPETATGTTDSTTNATAEKEREVNGVQCLNCMEVIISEHRHDFKWCECESVFVDGGKDYVRRGFTENAKFNELMTVKDVEEALELCE